MSGQNQSAAPGGFLGTVERVGNKLPDPAVLFIALLFIVWVLSWLLSYVTFDVIDPRSGEGLVIQNLLTGSSFTEFLSVMVTNFSHFHPVGVVLVAMLGIGVAEHTGFINAAIRSLLNPRDPAGWRHLLCCRPTSARGYRCGIRGCIGRFLR
jgi:aminobenzoyl-glutamate transport protein